MTDPTHISPAITAKPLSLDESVSLDWHELLERLAAFATADLAREKIKTLNALAIPEEALESMREIEAWQIVSNMNVRPQMTSLDLFTPWHNRLVRNAVLRTIELKDVRNFCQEVAALKEILHELPNRGELYGRLHAVDGKLMAAEEPLSAIDQIITVSGEIRTDASERLYQLNAEKKQLARQVQTILDRLVKSFQIEHLIQDRYVTTREGRWVLPIRSGMQHGFEGIIHASSQTKQTVFMEPKETVPLNNRLREIEIAIEDEIEHLLTDLSKYLATLRFQFEESKEIMLAADIRLAQAKLATFVQATSCEFSSELILSDLRHPLLVLNTRAHATQEREVVANNVVANTVELIGGRRILLLSGPNAGGKTVLLKSIGLAAQMARSGLSVCAAGKSRLPFFTDIIVALGDSQSVDANLSTFAAHLRALERAATVSGENTLLLIDEICGSTDPEEGAALARSFIESYKENRSFGVITSHLGSLKRGWERDKNVINGSLEFDQNSGPTFRFILGVPGPSLAIQTAQRIGVNRNIIEKAKEFLSPDAREYQTALSEIDRMKKDLLDLTDAARAERLSAEAARVAMEQARDSLMNEKDAILAKELSEAKRKLDDLIQEAKAQEIFQRHDRLSQIKRDLPQVLKGERQTPSKETRILTVDDFSRICEPGTRVYIKNLDRNGIVQGRPNGRDEVPVLSNSMRLMVSWHELEPVADDRSAANLLRSRSAFVAAPKETDRVLDVRGSTVEDAVSRLEIELDKASVDGLDRVKIIHGHGTTDALKRGVRNYLSRSVYVKKWLAGTKETGGDGVTWAELADA